MIKVLAEDRRPSDVDFSPVFTITLELKYAEFMDDIGTTAYMFGAEELKGHVAGECASLFGQGLLDEIEKFEMAEYGELRYTAPWARAKRADTDYEAALERQYALLKASEEQNG